MPLPRIQQFGISGQPNRKLETRIAQIWAKFNLKSWDAHHSNTHRHMHAKALKGRVSQGEKKKTLPAAKRDGKEFCQSLPHVRNHNDNHTIFFLYTWPWTCPHMGLTTLASQETHKLSSAKYKLTTKNFFKWPNI